MVSIQVYIKTKTNMITSLLYQQQHNNVNRRQKGQKGRLEMKNKMILSKRGLVQFYDWLSNKRRHVYTNVHRNRTEIAWMRRRREKRWRTIYWTEHFNYFEACMNVTFSLQFIERWHEKWCLSFLFRIQTCVKTLTF